MGVTIIGTLTRKRGTSTKTVTTGTNGSPLGIFWSKEKRESHWIFQSTQPVTQAVSLLRCFHTTGKKDFPRKNFSQKFYPSFYMRKVLSCHQCCVMDAIFFTDPETVLHSKKKTKTKKKKKLKQKKQKTKNKTKLALNYSENGNSILGDQ